MCLVASSMNGPDVDDLFAGGVCKSSPRQTEQAKDDQDDSKSLVHSSLLLLQQLFDLPDFFFDFAGVLFGSPLSLQVRIVCDLACLLLKLPGWDCW